VVHETANRLRRRLKSLGLSAPAIEAAWPTWWSDDADASASAKVELRFSLSRKLGLDPRSLLEEGEPRFVWRDVARFKHLAGETEIEKAAITSFGAALGNILIGAATPSWRPIPGVAASKLREAVRQDHPFVRLVDLLSICWSVGTPIVHLRIFPWPQKRMSAMTVRVGGRTAILLGKDSLYPAHISFYVAHELAHIALGHLQAESIMVDLDRDDLADAASDPEEADADRYALELLTGDPRPTVLNMEGRASARALANAALKSGEGLGIEPGTLALCFGYSTGKWDVANGAMRHIYASPKPVWHEVNKIAVGQMSLESVPDDARSYLTSVLGGTGSG
jgi:hypothetical protein